MQRGMRRRSKDADNSRVRPRPRDTADKSLFVSPRSTSYADRSYAGHRWRLRNSKLREERHARIIPW